jgi:hypothetical protein
MAAQPAAKDAALVIASIPDLKGNGIVSLELGGIAAGQYLA